MDKSDYRSGIKKNGMKKEMNEEMKIKIN